MLEPFYDEVGPGWRPILETLNQRFLGVCAAEPLGQIKIDQVKEKFGRLQVYTTRLHFSDWALEALSGYATDAFLLSCDSCEECGATEGVVCRGPLGQKFGWMKTYCEEHHAERDARGVGSLRDK